MINLTDEALAIKKSEAKAIKDMIENGKSGYLYYKYNKTLVYSFTAPQKIVFNNNIKVIEVRKNKVILWIDKYEYFIDLKKSDIKKIIEFARDT